MESDRSGALLKQRAKQLISIVVPMHNESESLAELHRELHRCTAKLPYTFEFILVDDGSRDDSVLIARRLAKEDARVRLLVLSRNFGKEPAVAAGIHVSRGAAVVIMDADLQHPPKLLGEFIAKWKAGAEVVIGVREYSKKESWFKKFASAWFYRIMQRIAHTQITPHATDFRLLDRGVVDEFNRLSEHNRINRGLIDWLGFERDYVHFVAPLRYAGEVSYTLQKLIALAINSVTAYSMVPLRLAGYLGVFILILAAPSTLFVIVEKYLLNDPLGLHFTGTAALAFMLLFLVGVILACLGLVALYIAQIHAEVINRPLYIVRKTEVTGASEAEEL
ncbi:MAG TPA: glycosyltransferase family 2 protein [Candidatus Saccharimonadales bacterium]|nr:glycosyltransferase family 2 protein [Candidatus Saccharimonadales bacterium]